MEEDATEEGIDCCRFLGVYRLDLLDEYTSVYDASV